MKNTKRINTQKGQVLLAVMVAVSVALAVGVSISTRTLSMSSRVARTDTSSRLIAAVEGGAERFLLLADCVLDQLADGSNYEALCSSQEVGNLTYDSEVGEGCIVDYSPSGEGNIDKIQSHALVSVEKFRYTSSPGSPSPRYTFGLNAGQSKEIPLKDSSISYTSSTIRLCWDDVDTAVSYLVYDTEGHISRALYVPSGFMDPNPADFIKELGVTNTYIQPTVGPVDEFDWCGDIELDKDGLVNGEVYGLRIKALYNSANFAVYTTSGASLPYQGYKIVSVGELSDDTEQTVVKTVTVYKSFPYLPDVFDYAIYSQSSF